MRSSPTSSSVAKHGRPAAIRHSPHAGGYKCGYQYHNYHIGSAGHQSGQPVCATANQPHVPDGDEPLVHSVVIEQRPCGWCGEDFTPSRPDRKYCSIVCRKRKMRWNEKKALGFDFAIDRMRHQLAWSARVNIHR